jgi:spermidine/putrescine transport system permease protein
VDRRRPWAWLPLAPALLVLLGLFAAPLGYFFAISFWSVRARMMRPDFTFANYAATWAEYGDVLLTTLLIALAIAALTTVVAFAFAFAIRFKLGRWGPAVLFFTLVTLFGGYLVKIYAWKSILGREGILNQALLGLGVVAEPVDALLYSTQGVVITLGYFLLPIAVLPIYGSLRAIRDVTLEAARDLGARPGRMLLDIVLPNAAPACSRRSPWCS